MNIVVRKYDDGDFHLADKILFESLGYHKEKMSDNRVYEFVACLDNVVVGYFNMLEEIDIIRNIKIYHIGYVCVDSNYRQRGIGHKMMEYAVSFAQERGACRLELTSGNQRVAAHKLYLSLGFIKRDSAIFRKELLWY